MSNAPLCPIHQTPMVCYCPRCRGSLGGKIGGRSTSQKKRRAAKRNARRARAAKPP